MLDSGVKLADQFYCDRWGAAVATYPAAPKTFPHQPRQGRLDAETHLHQTHLQRTYHRAGNQLGSEQVIAGMLLLLAVCGWVNGGEEGARRALAVGSPAFDGPISPEVMLHRYGARRLQFHELPAVFKTLREICRRARLARVPDLYYIADPSSMNAYALGKPDHSAITITEGLVRGLTPSELTAILAHEVAHICNHDGSAMGWAAALQRAIATTSAGGLLALHAQSRASARDRPLTVLLSGAAVIAQLLSLCLSRLREFDADALALELLDDPQAFVTALGKLERHHSGYEARMMRACQDELQRYLRSHPETAERVGRLQRLCY